LDVSGVGNRDIVVQAGGGLVWRDDPALVLLVHRPRYDDWSFPKGKADPGETPEETALREVEEETGLACTLGAPAGETRYRDAKGRPKIVRYWHMDPAREAPEFTPNDEVDELRWCSREVADGLLTYDHDRKLLRQAATPGRPH
jgi:8-oxo-dGTP diphosphatase